MVDHYDENKENWHPDFDGTKKHGDDMEAFGDDNDCHECPDSTINPIPFFQRLVNAYYNPVTGDNINDNGVAITYENKDELSAEDIESAGADK
jgi:hypothetical protein